MALLTLAAHHLEMSLLFIFALLSHSGQVRPLLPLELHLQNPDPHRAGPSWA